jgi:hypothetical protein
VSDFGQEPWNAASQARQRTHAFASASTHPLPLINRHEFSADRLTYILA